MPSNSSRRNQIHPKDRNTRDPPKNWLHTHKFSPKNMDGQHMWANTRKEFPLPESQENQEFFEKKADADYRKEWRSEDYYQGDYSGHEKSAMEKKWADYTDEDNEESAFWHEFVKDIANGDVPWIVMCYTCHNQPVDERETFTCRFC